ncbi:nuclear transport factor 2 family protein [Clostridium sp. 19966]|uniref:nuclear transport factor 2 family protein n=1 Tax=Clostridium sp. 19966 TaxID=2768166 RepID=UPI0028DD81B0|nr:nuclear transport factor 2 family protein [Clostridium sp. 19966]MDT8717157.1 nuclear transport factor 2 family protein [Clostridium sp. 19966]
MKEIVRRFWRYINDASFDKLNEVMNEDASVYLVNTREVFEGREKYIKFNKRYSGRWYAELEELYSMEDTVISIARVFNSLNNASSYVVAIFKFKNGLIQESKEYWSENGEAPKWRLDEKLSKVY